MNGVHQCKALIYEDALRDISGWTSQFSDLETGGEFFGFWTDSGSPVVQLVLGPGPNVRRTAASFYQDRGYLEQMASHLHKTHGLQHIGSWHSHHHLGLKHPSGGDVNTVCRCIQNIGLKRWLLCIATFDSMQTDHDDRYQSRSRETKDSSGARDGWGWHSSNKPLGSVFLSPFLFEKDSYSYKSGAWVVLPGVSPFMSSQSVLAPRFVEHMSLPSKGTYSDKIPKTSLNAPVVGVFQPDVPVWYTTDKGKKILKELTPQLEATWGKVIYSADSTTKELLIQFSVAMTFSSPEKIDLQNINLQKIVEDLSNAFLQTLGLVSGDNSISPKLKDYWNDFWKTLDRVPDDSSIPQKFMSYCVRRNRDGGYGDGCSTTNPHSSAKVSRGQSPPIETKKIQVVLRMPNDFPDSSPCLEVKGKRMVLPMQKIASMRSFTLDETEMIEKIVSTLVDHIKEQLSVLTKEERSHS